MAECQRPTLGPSHAPAARGGVRLGGTIHFDIERDAFGNRPDGKPTTLKELWPSDGEIDAVLRVSVQPRQFRHVYDPMSRRDSKAWRA